MHRWIAVVLIACGSGRSADSTLVIDDPPKPVPIDAAPATTATTPARPAITANLSVEEACARFDTLAGQSCEWTQRFPAAFRDMTNCVSSLQTWVKDPKLQKSIGCWALECEAAAQCMVASHADTTPPPARKCGEEGTGPVIADAGTWAARPGANAKKFSEVQSSEAKPVEVCGIEGEVEWITRVKCNDGSNPFGSQAKANESRDSYMARGGRCNSILDRYSVKCPEATYQVFIDRYVCPEKR